MNVGNKIAKLRVKSNLTQDELASKLFVSRDLVSKWENNKRRPDYKTIQSIANILNVSPDAIITSNEILFEELKQCIGNISEENFQEVLNQFLNTLNVRYKAVFIRRYYYMDEISEISQKYNIPASHIRTILTRTRHKLHNFCKEVK